MRINALVPLLLFLGISSLPAADAVIISEFMALNDRTVADEDGDFPDWIELFNAGTTTVDLAGWYLTDSPSDLRQWRFPATNLPPGVSMLVFASSKDRKTAGRPLHTNFKLDDAGEYLALVQPDGTNVAFAYSPAYPQQLPDISYGVPVRQTTVSLLASGAPARWFVPPSDILGTNWPLADFDDSGWMNVVTGVGYESDVPNPVTPVVLADSVADFGGAQGANNWFYGYWSKKADTNGLYESADFTAFPRGTGNVVNATNYWDGGKWSWPLPADPPWTELTSTGGHPAAENGNASLPVHWTIRRYVAETDGPIRISGTLACSGTSGTCGDGIVGRIFVDGVEVYHQPVFGTSVGYSLRLVVATGAKIDFAIDPGPASNDSCDGTTFTAVVRTMGDATVVADSIADWSLAGTQGEKNWRYGYWNAAADASGYQMNDFIPFPGAPGPFSSVNYWNGESWKWFEGDPPWTEIGQIVTHPNGIAGQTSDKADGHWTIRRWVSEVAGSLIVDWHVSKRDLAGDGVTAKVLHNGAIKDTLAVAAADFVGTNRAIAITGVQVGDYIDFTIENGTVTNAIGDGTFLNAAIYGSGSLSGQFVANVESTMRPVNASAYLRIPFSVTDPGRFASLTLGMKYDDGFVAYLNGVLVASRNAPETPTWNSAATAERPDPDAIQYEEFNLSNRRDLLQAGNNVLAIHGLNRSAADGDFLILPVLWATEPALDTAQRNYFQPPTPGFLNGVGNTNLGPLVTEVLPIPAEPLDQQDLLVTARILQTFNPVGTVRLYYRVMYRAESNLVMADDGAHGDGVAGDGIYGAIIPHTAYTNGEMVRYYITAADASNHITRLPPFPDTTASEQYLGTVVFDPTLTNPLPVMHWFIQTPGSADSDAGTRCSIYYGGEFYDNVYFNLHGQSSRGFPKKSYDIDFNPDHHFRYDPNEPRVDDVNMLTTYPDKAQMRNMLGYETHRDSGLRSPYHWVAPVRVQMNSRFQGTWHLVENGDADFVKRIGRDPNGAFYKMYDTMANVSTAEKKTRRNEDKSDLQALLDNLVLADQPRRDYMYDNVDVSQVVNYLAAMIITSNRDCCHKNYYVYRDTEGDGEWEMFPWDVDLSFGRNWDSTQTYWLDPMYADNDLFVGGNCRLPSAIFNTPPFRQMYLRRLRTLMDTLQQPTNTPPDQLKYERRINELAALLEPDAIMDLNKWGTWGNGTTGIFDTNSIYWKPLPEAVSDIVTNYLPKRRDYLFSKNNSAITGAGELPDAQPTNTLMQFVAIDFNPASGNQAQEYIQLRNTNAYAVDMSMWSITGAVEHVFQAGVVVPAGSNLFVVADKKAFRARTTPPRGRQQNFVEGPYQGQLSARGETIALLDEVGRLVTTNAYAGNPSPAQQYLRVTEIMYHPPSPGVGSLLSEEDFEFIELQNISAGVTLDLRGVRLVDGVEFNFTGSAVTNLSPGAYVLLVRNRVAFAARYGTNHVIAGEYVGALDNAGENLRIDDAVGEKVLDFKYDNKWYPVTDGAGCSLVIVDASAAWNTWGQKASWRPSAYGDGSPGQMDPPRVEPLPVLVSEVLTRTDPPMIDAIELWNTNAVPVNVGGWFISDDLGFARKFRIPDNTMIPAGGFVVFDERDFNPTNPPSSTGFAFDGNGDEAYLFSGDGTNLTGYIDGYQFGPADTGYSFGRHLTSLGEVKFVAQSTLTLGTNNSSPRVGPMVINEIMYHPPDLPGSQDNAVDEYVELLNVSGADVPLFDPLRPANSWRVRGGVNFNFPTADGSRVTVPAGGYLILVGFNPTNSAQLSAFRSKYGVSESVPVLGPWSGKLDNSQEDVELLKPGIPEGLVRPFIRMDRVEYKDSVPWPSAADGLGLSLQRRVSTEFGDDPANWIAAAPTAGAGRPSGTAPEITLQPANQVVFEGETVSLSAGVSGTPPLSYQWRKNGTNIFGAVAASLVFPNIQTSDQGAYSVVVYNVAGSTESSNATVTVRIPVKIVRQPFSTNVYVGTNVTFSVLASSSRPISYQWRYNGGDIPAATNAAYSISNVQRSHEGTYQVLVMDPISSVLSQPAYLMPMVKIGIVQSPQPRTNTVGSSATFSMSITGYPPPFTFEFRKVSTPLQTNVTSSSNVTFTLDNIQHSDAGQYRIVAMSLSSPSPGVSGAANLSVLGPPVITQDLTNSYVNPGGSNFTFIVGALGTTNFGVFWYFHETNLLTTQITNRSPFSSSLTLTNVQEDRLGRYSVVISNAYGSVTSSVVDLVYRQPASIVQGPTNLTVVVGQAARFSVLGDGGGPYVYRWYFNNGAASMPGQISNTLVLNNVQLSNAGPYHVVVSNSMGSATSSPAILTVLEPPRIVTGPTPTNQAVVAGNTAAFSVVAAGLQPLSYQWLFGLTNILVGETNSDLVLTNLQAADEGLYSVWVTNLAGTITSTPASLVVLLPPRIVTQPQSQTVPAGDPAVLEAEVVGSSPLRFQWYFSDTNALAGATNPTYVLPSVQPADVGGYHLVITNAYGQVTSEVAQVSILASPEVITSPVSQTVHAGGSVIFSVDATGSPPLTYLWLFNETNVVAGGVGASLELNPVQAENAGRYQVVVSNMGGSATSAVALLTVLVPPAIVTQPTNQVVAAGGSASFVVGATGTEPLSYQWFFNATNLVEGGTNTSLLLTNVQLTDAGDYLVVVTNVAGAATSAVAALTLSSGDADGDGMPDDWERDHGLDPGNASDRDLDLDSDTMTNWQEFIAGTDPQVRESHLRLDRIIPGGTILIEFTAISNRSYSVFLADRLGGLWSKLADVEAASTNRLVTLSDTNAPPQRYYRLVVPKQN